MAQNNTTILVSLRLLILTHLPQTNILNHKFSLKIAKFTAREASHPNSRKGLAHPRRFKIEPKTKMAEEELLKTEEISVPPEEIRCFGFRFTVPYKIIGNTTTYACSNQTNSRETLGSSSSTDTADDELISLFYFCLVSFGSEKSFQLNYQLKTNCRWRSNLQAQTVPRVSTSSRSLSKYASWTEFGILNPPDPPRLKTNAFQATIFHVPSLSLSLISRC